MFYETTSLLQLQHLVAPSNNQTYSDEDFLAFTRTSICSPTTCGACIHSRVPIAFYSDFINGPTVIANAGGIYFGHVGFLLRNTDKNLEESLKDRIITFFEWRLEVGEAAEFGDFHFWLVSEALETEWRLDAYSRILGLCQDHDLTMMSIETDALGEMIPDYTRRRWLSASQS